MKRYKRYLYDATCDVPVRTKHRLKTYDAARNAGGDLLPVAQCSSTDGSMMDESDSDGDTLIPQAFLGGKAGGSPRGAELSGEPHGRRRSETVSSDYERNNAVEESFSDGGDSNVQDFSSSDDDACDSASEAASEAKNELVSSLSSSVRRLVNKNHGERKPGRKLKYSLSCPSFL